MSWWNRGAGDDDDAGQPELARVYSFEEGRQRREEGRRLDLLAAAQRSCEPDHLVERPLWIAAWPCRNCGETRPVTLSGSIYLCNECGGGGDGDDRDLA